MWSLSRNGSCTCACASHNGTCTCTCTCTCTYPGHWYQRLGRKILFTGRACWQRGCCNQQGRNTNANANTSPPGAPGASVRDPPSCHGGQEPDGPQPARRVRASGPRAVPAAARRDAAGGRARGGMLPPSAPRRESVAWSAPERIILGMKGRGWVFTVPVCAFHLQTQSTMVVAMLWNLNLNLTPGSWEVGLS